MHACKSIEREMTLDTKLSATIEILKEKINNVWQKEKIITDNEKFRSQFFEQIQKEVGDKDFNTFFKDIEIK